MEIKDQELIALMEWLVKYKPVTANGRVMYWHKDNYQSKERLSTEEVFAEYKKVRNNKQGDSVE